jgi:glycosyltransferase involved in cell wall biosynthesis
MKSLVTVRGGPPATMPSLENNVCDHIVTSVCNQGNRSPLLGIAIPTYNRASGLNRVLASLVANCNKSPSVSIYVFDNASSDETKMVCEQFIKDVIVVGSTINLGGVANIQRCLSMTPCEYVWLVSDHMEILPGAIPRLVETVKTLRPDVVCAGISNYNFMNFSRVNEKMLVSSLSNSECAKVYFHLSNISSIVVSRSILDRSRKSISQCGRKSYPHLGIWPSLERGATLAYIPSLTEFSRSKLGRSYAWFESGVLDFGSTAILNFGETGRQGAVLKGLIGFKSFRNRILRYALESRAGIVKEAITGEKRTQFNSIYKPHICFRLAFASISILPACAAAAILALLDAVKQRTKSAIIARWLSTYTRYRLEGKKSGLPLGKFC